MENNTNTDTHEYPTSTVPMVKIDGAKVRKLREGKKLTQLYLSTVVGVTTDTISRWENRHYQSVKLENAQKLAQALEVSFEDILTQEISPEPDETTLEPITKDEIKPRELPPISKTIIATTVLVTVLLCGVVLYNRVAQQPAQQTVFATRVLPPHAAPGQTFPVLIRVSSSLEDPVSLIINELLPQGAFSTEGLPQVTSIDSKDNSLKWIRRLDTEKAVYAYLCNVPTDIADNSLLGFEGSVTLKKNVKGKQPIFGDEAVRVAPYHWADSNRDYMIDDEEVLAVYDTYSDIEQLPFDRELIDSIWASSGYAWNPDKELFVTTD